MSMLDRNAEPPTYMTYALGQAAWLVARGHQPISVIRTTGSSGAVEYTFLRTDAVEADLAVFNAAVDALAQLETRPLRQYNPKPAVTAATEEN